MGNIVIVGEAWGEREEAERTPFVGAAGWELTRMLNEAGIHRSECFLTNVFNLRPKNNEIETLCCSQSEPHLSLPALVRGRFVRAIYGDHLERLGEELIRENPNIVIALGNTAAWALLGTTGISKLRGTVCTSTHTITGFKVLPTYHPAAVLRQWDLRPVTVLDLRKAKRESEYPEVVRPAREIWIEPTLEDLEEFYNAYIIPCQRLSVDIETAGEQITCIGFAPRRDIALVTPFVDPRRARGSYWPNKETERQAWGFVRRALSCEAEKVFQNGLYDIAFLWRSYGLTVRNPKHDTMLLHHALQPESPKNLGFLGSVYTNEPAWKLMRKGSQTIKRDE